MGRLSRNGYTLEKILGWTKEEYSEVQVRKVGCMHFESTKSIQQKRMKAYAEDYLDTTQILSKQARRDVDKVHAKVLMLVWYSMHC